MYKIFFCTHSIATMSSLNKKQNVNMYETLWKFCSHHEKPCLPPFHSLIFPSLKSGVAVAVRQTI